MELTQDEVFIFVGRQTLELAQLRAQLVRLAAHRCPERTPCPGACCDETPPDE